MSLIYLEGVMFDENIITLLHCPINITGVYKIPSTVKKIGIQAFYGCSRLLNINLPENLEVINMLAFEGCRHLSSICIPETVKSINYRAFANCTGLKTIQIEHEKPLTCSSNCDIFKNVDLSQCTLIVPVGTRIDYMTASVWRDFGSIVEIGQAKEKLSDKEKRKIVGIAK
jgi:hypothetical protein